jgi:glyoxylase-like metal-dependent hydrolase (beta-lactamase superfamily II)
MELKVIDTGYFKLDGGAMFGVVPKQIWSKTNPADELNLCTWAMRCLLIKNGARLILIDTGIGQKQSDQFFGHYHLQGTTELHLAIQQAGYSPDEITDVLLTHLHFDHCGGAILRDPQSERLIPSFKNANYWSNARHWEWATKPNAREKASFLSENILPIQESGQLQFIERGENERMTSPLGFDIWFVDGHTDSMMIPLIPYQGKTLAYMADLLPSVGHIPLAYVMGYDTRPLITLEEKRKFLTTAQQEQWMLFLEHDPINECCNLQMTEKGIRLDQAFKKGEWQLM